MTQPIELILLRQWSTYQAIPVWIIDINGDLLFYNEAAEATLGIRYEEAGAIHASEMADIFQTTALDGSAIPSEDLPIVVALRDRHPAHGELRIKAGDGAARHLHITAFPVEGLSDRHLGAVAMFWEEPIP